MNTVSTIRSTIRSTISKKPLFVAVLAGVVGLGTSAACLAGPYVVLKGGASTWEDFEGDDNDTYASVGVGFNGGKYFSFEFAYNDFGKVEGDEAGTITADAYSTSVAGYVHWPMFEHFGWFLKAGVEAWKADLDFAGETDRANGTGAFAGAGAKASFGTVDISVFYELHKFDEQGQRSDEAELYDDFDIDVVGAGVAYRF